MCVTNLPLKLATGCRFILGIAPAKIDIGDSHQWFYNGGVDVLVDIGIPAEKEVIQ
jgi:hypothetical protein